MTDLGHPLWTGNRATEAPRCRSYVPGHGVHPLRVQLTTSSPDEDWAAVVVMGAVDDVVTVAVGDELRRYRNHDAGRLVELVARVGADALLNLRYGLLFLRSWPRESDAAFSVQPAGDPPQPCRPR
jgi:hypothetical protein